MHRFRHHLTWTNVIVVLILAAVALALWLSDDVSAGWTVGNYR